MTTTEKLNHSHHPDLLCQLPTENKLLILNFLIVFFDYPTTNHNNNNNNNNNTDDDDVVSATDIPHTTTTKNLDPFMQHNAQFCNEPFLFNNIQSLIRLSMVNSHWHQLMLSSRMNRLWKCCLYGMTQQKSLIKQLTRTCKQQQKNVNVSILLKNECVKQWFSLCYCENRQRELTLCLESCFPLDSAPMYQKKKPMVLRRCKQLLMTDKRLKSHLDIGENSGSEENDKSENDNVLESAPSVHSSALTLFCQLFWKYCRIPRLRHEPQKQRQYSWWLLRDLLSLFVECGIHIYESFEFEQLGSPLNADMVRFCFFSALNVVNADDGEGLAVPVSTILILCLHDDRNMENELLMHFVSLLSEREMDLALRRTEKIVDMPLEAYVGFRLDPGALSCLAPHISQFRKSVPEPYSLAGLGNKFLSMFFSQLNIGSPTNFKSIIKTMVQYCQLDLNEKVMAGDDFLLRWFSYWRNSESSLQIDHFMLDIVLFLVNEMKMDIGTTNDAGNTIMHYLVRENPAFHAVSPLFTNGKLRPHMIQLLSKENTKNRIPIEEHLEYIKKLPPITRSLDLDYRILRILCEYTDPKVCKQRKIAPQIINILKDKNVSTTLQQQLTSKMT